MPLFYCRPGLLGLLMLGAGLAARAQTTTDITTTLALPLTPYAAAHDSLMRRVRQVYAQAEAHTGYFHAARGSFGGLHRRVQTYARTSRPLLVKREAVKHKFGVELQKVRYYDDAGHVVLAERYEGHQLVWLELWEYPARRTQYGRPAATWLLVRGDYLRHRFLSAPNHTTINYYYQLRPAGEAL